MVGGGGEAEGGGEVGGGGGGEDVGGGTAGAGGTREDQSLGTGSVKQLPDSCVAVTTCLIQSL